MEEIRGELRMNTGLSLKKAAKIADMTARCNVRGVLYKNSQSFNIGSVLQMASSGIQEGDAVSFSCRGERAQEAMKAIMEILEQTEE